MSPKELQVEALNEEILLNDELDIPGAADLEMAYQDGVADGYESALSRIEAEVAKACDYGGEIRLRDFQRLLDRVRV